MFSRNSIAFNVMMTAKDRSLSVLSCNVISRKYYINIYAKTFRVNLYICLGSNAGPGDQSTVTSKEGTPANDVSATNNSSQGSKNYREARRPPRMQQSNKPKEALVNGTSG